jgi:CDP-diacylglycerol--serine O-phosphatidyltransferase
MVSRVRYYSFKAVDLRRRRPYVVIIVLGLIVWAIWRFSEPVLLAMALSYALSGPIARLTSRFRPHPPAPEEVHAA